MKQQTFISPHWPNRPVTVKITDEFITFHIGEDNDNEFYWIPTNEWVNDCPKIGIADSRKELGWHQHMEDKIYFTSSIRKFINNTLGLQDSGKILPQDKLTERDILISKRAKENGGILDLSQIFELYKEDLENLV